MLQPAPLADGHTIARPPADIYTDFAELAARTRAQDPDDQLAGSDWWAVISRPMSRDDAYRRAWRLKKQTKKPPGLWSVTIRKTGEGTVVIARFEGDRPGWEGRSQHAKDTDDRWVVGPHVPRRASRAT